MSCSNPMQAICNGVTRSGKKRFTFIQPVRKKEGWVKNVIDKIGRFVSRKQAMVLPCGTCALCRLERSRLWAIRMCNEADLHEQNCFATFTFDEPSLNARDNPNSLNKLEFQKCLKRMRKKFGKFRYYMCGEYGDETSRPHYHVILFGLDFPDKIWEKTVDGREYFSSALLRECWPFGNNIITDCNFDTCAYVARYLMKKVNGDKAAAHYGQRIPEYTTMSRRPGIGKDWLDIYLQDVYPRDEIYMRNRGWSKPPKYYDSKYEIINPEDHARLKDARRAAAKAKAPDNIINHLEAMEYIKLQAVSSLKPRNVE